MRRITGKHAAGAAGAIALAAVIGYQFEGERHTVYRDIVGVATYCIGETRNPQWGHVYTHDECMKIYEGRLAEFDQGVRNCVDGEMTTGQEAAFIDLAYNIGIAGFCKSSVVRHFNAGNKTEACNAILLYDHAGGKKVRGLTRRREAERRLCLGIKEAP